MNKQKEKLAILVPYRDRKEHLNTFSIYMNNFMKNNFPNINYDILIIEQYGNYLFNRGKLLNVGAHITKEYDYFILHDIDMLPISVDYSYNENVQHLAKYVYEQSPKGDLNLFYVSKDLVQYAGGVLKIPKNIFYDINGFDNDYWGWGGEDDELKIRLKLKDYNIDYEKNEKNHYITLKHDAKRFLDGENYINNYNKSKKSNKGKIDNNGLNTLKYDILKTEYNDNYILYLVDIKRYKTFNDIEGWFSFKDIYDDVIQKYNNGIFVEIGAWFGKSTSYMAQELKRKNKNIKFYVIDTWEGTEGLPVGNIAKKLGGNVYHIFEKNMIECGVINDINIVKESSFTAHNKFENNSIDFILIDGDHRYEGVKNDINNWYPKIKTGGIIAGDDYDKQSVKKAIDEFCYLNDIKLSQNNNNWLIKK